MPSSRALWTTERKEPMEILSKLAGRTTFVVPTEGRGGLVGNGTPADIAHALASSGETLGKQLVLAMIFETMAGFSSIQTSAYEWLLHELQRDWHYADMLEGPKRCRLRLVLHDAVYDMVWPQRKRSVSLKSTDIGMRRADYRKLYRFVRAKMDNSARNAARDAHDFLFRD